jgi:hypothetical protein
MPLLGHPESHFVSPLFLLTALFGPIAGLKIELPVYMAICWAGGYVLGRTVGLRPLAALAPAVLFASSSWLYERAVEGQISILAFAYLPWVLAAAWRATERKDFRDAILGGLVLGLAFLEGGPYPLAFIVTVSGILILARMVSDRSLRPAIMLALIVAVAIGFSAFKFFPAFAFARHNPRPTPDIQFNPLAILWRVLFSSIQKPLQGLDNGYGFWESGAYLGLSAIPALLALATPRRCAVWIFSAAIVFLLARGNSGWLWPLLHDLPPYSSLRIPSRFLIALVLLVGVLAGFGLDWLCGFGRWWGTAAAAVLLSACSLQTLRTGPPLLWEVINAQLSPGASMTHFSQIFVGPYGNHMTIAAMENYGVVRVHGLRARNDQKRRLRPRGLPGRTVSVGKRHRCTSGVVAGSSRVHGQRSCRHYSGDQSELRFRLAGGGWRLRCRFIARRLACGGSSERDRDSRAGVPAHVGGARRDGERAYDRRIDSPVLEVELSRVAGKLPPRSLKLAPGVLAEGLRRA